MTIFPLKLDRYLWVAFQIDSICAQQTDADILSALNDLPKDLPETFNRILRKLRQSRALGPNSNLPIKIFNIVAAARRPLTLDEIREAVTVEPGNSKWDPTKAVNDIFKLIKDCGCLLMIDEELHTVHFTHYSVRQYLCSNITDKTVDAYQIDMDSTSSILGRICITYLNYDIFESQLTKASPTPQQHTITPSAILGGSSVDSSITCRLAINI